MIDAKKARAQIDTLREAIRLAQKIPPARYGSVEIRPVRELMEEGNRK